MVNEPMNALVMQAYRDTLLVNGAPSYIDSSNQIIPVAVVATATSASVAQFFKLTDGTDNANVVGDALKVIESWTIPSGATIINVTTETVTTTYATIYTVTAGKTAYITDVSCGSFGSSSLLQIGESGTTRHNFICAPAGAGVSHAFKTPLTFAGSSTIQIRGGAGITGGAFSIRGFEI